MTQKAPDKYVERNREALLERSLLGVSKYGTTIESSPQRSPEWAQHAIEEALDLANYLQALKDQCELDREILLKMQKFLQGTREMFLDPNSVNLAKFDKELELLLCDVTSRINAGYSNGNNNSN